LLCKTPWCAFCKIEQLVLILHVGVLHDRLSETMQLLPCFDAAASPSAVA
jgi:hypothetical protein